MKHRAHRTATIAIIAILALIGFAPPAARGATGEQSADDLDGRCAVLRVTTTGTTSGAANYIERASVGYGTRGTVATAEPVAFEATGLDRYRLYDSTGAVLYLSVADFVWAGSEYGDRADWTITLGASGYRIRSTLTDAVIGSRSGQLTVSDASFALEPATGCASPPAAATGMVSPAAASPVNADGTLNGLIDAHAHPVASAAFGGEMICGEPFAAGGIEDALGGCASHAAGAGALFEAIIGGTDPFGGDDGWPTFTDWPTTTSLLHEQAYYVGIERAWQGGLRVFNALLVGNRVICELYPARVTSCDEMAQIRAQADLLHEMQDYIDAQSGGAGEGWFRIARTPEEVRAIAAEGKLAVTIGVESSELFGCRVIADIPQCDPDDIDAGLDELTALGVSGLYPVHKFDNAFGGTRFDPGVTGVALNVGNYLSTQRFWTAESCTGPADNEQTITNDGIADLLTSLTGSPAGTVLPVYPTGPLCNTRGLTDLGEYLIEELMERGMVIHIDHMGVRTADAVLDLAEAAGYAGVAAVHTWSDRAITARVAQDGGFVASYAYAASDAGNGEPDFLSEWQANVAAAGDHVLTAYGYGSDVNGLAAQPGARLDATADPLAYPFTAPNGAVFDRQTYGQRTWDINTDGVAQYGMYADWIADVMQYAGDDDTDLSGALMRGAEAYVQMWEESLAW
jgi:microsomal dipeptidase-like Zn-dependent dipeptidase